MIAWKVNIIAGTLPRYRLDWTLDVHDKCVTKLSSPNVVKELVVTYGIGVQSVLGLDDLSS